MTTPKESEVPNTSVPQDEASRSEAEGRSRKPNTSVPQDEDAPSTTVPQDEK